MNENEYFSVCRFIGAIIGISYCLIKLCGNFIVGAFDAGAIIGGVALIIALCISLGGGMVGAIIAMVGGTVLALIARRSIKIYSQISKRCRILKDSFLIYRDTKYINQLLERRSELMTQYKMDRNNIKSIGYLSSLMYLLDEHSCDSEMILKKVKTIMQAFDEIETIEKKVSELGDKYLAAGNKKMAEHYYKTINKGMIIR